MILVGRAHSLFQFGLKTARNLSCSTELRISLFTKASRLLCGVVGMAALSALAACQQASSSGQTTNSDPSAAGTSKPAATLGAIKGSVTEVTLTASPATVGTGGTTHLSWKSSNATACIASGGWSGPVATSGTWSTDALSNTTVYELTCTGTGGSVTQSATITVSALAPVVALGANPSSIEAGERSMLSWSAGNATACSASGAWSGGKSLAGSQPSGALTASTTYTLTCTGVRGTASQSVTVSVKSLAPSITLAATPSTIASGTSSTLKWNALNARSCSASGAWAGSKVVSGSQSTGIKGANATYTLTCSGPGGNASQSATVSIKSPTPTVSLSAGPSAITSGSSATLNWSAMNATTCVASSAWSGAKAVHGSQSTGALKANATYVLTCTGAGGTAAQSATVSVSAHPSVTVSFSAIPSTVASGGTSKLTWSSSNATTCTASGGWSGAKAISGSQSSGGLTANTTYGLTCTGTGGGSSTQSATVSVTSAAPVVHLSASPSTVAGGGVSTLIWSSSNATSCVASGAWAGAKAVSGSQTTGALTSSTTYGLSCTGSGGSALQSTTVSVTSPAPTITLTASPSTVASGASSTLSWSATHATSCTASGGWSGTKTASGSQSTGTLTADETYGLICTGPGGSAAQSATVSVTKVAPAIVLSASPSTVKSGAASTLTWSSTNATACTASGGWTGSLATSGARATGAVNATTTYTISCTGSGGTATQSAIVTVTSSTSNGTATVSWEAPTINTDGTTVTNLSGYTIYYGTSQSDLTQSVVVSGAATLSYEITGLAAGTWYFAVAADGADGTESAMSSIGSKTL